MEVGRHPKITILSYSSLKRVKGKAGRFRVQIERKPRYVLEEKCNGCGLCWENCPSVVIPFKRRIKLGDAVIGSNVEK